MKRNRNDFALAHAGKKAGPHGRGAHAAIDGFSLVEVIVAVAIMSMALVGLVRGITMALSSSKESELQTTAALFASGLVENLRAEENIRDGDMQGACGEELPLYGWTQSITGAGIDGLHDVDVAIQNTRSGETIYELRTLLFEPPEQPTANDSKNGRDKARRRGNS